MEVQFEVGVKPKKIEVKVDKKDELKSILDKAGVEYNAQLGEKKLQALVDKLD